VHGKRSRQDEEEGFLEELSVKLSTTTDTPASEPTGGGTQVFSHVETPEEDLDLECTVDEGDIGAMFAETAPVRILQMTRLRRTQDDTPSELLF
jgi:hypothetical protein